MSEPIVEEAFKFLSNPLKHPIAELSILRQSLLFAEVSKVAYYRDDLVRTAAEMVGFDRIEFFDRDGAQAYLVSNQHDCIIACRGTEPHEWNDVKADVDAISVVAETVGRVHRGFKREVDDLWPRLEKALKENDKTLYFTGHSLGGAMATICAGRCKLSEIPSNPEALFTFGSPRVGNRRYINFVKIPHYRWVNNNDIVCRVPPQWFGYSHSGMELYLDSQGRLIKYTPWRRFTDRMRGLFQSLGRWQIDYLADHSMVRYLESIHQAAINEEAGLTKPIKPLHLQK